MSLSRLRNGGCFYHVPKTGGRAFKFNKKLKSPTTHRRVNKKQAKKMAITVIIRDPVDRFLSAYYFTKACSTKGVHKKDPTVLKIKKYGWRSSPLEMVTAILHDTNDIDKIIFCYPNSGKWSHFNTQYWWHLSLNPPDVTYIDYKNLNLPLTPRGKPYRGSTSGRVPLDDEPDLQKIVDSIRILYKADYDYFGRIPQTKSITDNWLK